MINAISIHDRPTRIRRAANSATQAWVDTRAQLCFSLLLHLRALSSPLIACYGRCTQQARYAHIALEMSESEGGKMAWLWAMFKHYLRTAWLRYKKLPIGGKVST